jgi:DNA (cytosine-5)-methyltransferase 1
VLTFGSLFAGIGGFDLGFERAGMRCEWQVENNPFCQRVLAKHWPHVRRCDDVRTFPPDGDWRVDVICGGFPCQDISNAGLHAGLAGERSGLWREFRRIIRLLRPRFVVVENVSALLADGMGVVLGDLADSGFDAEWQIVQASDFALPHRRQRVFIVAYPNGCDGEAAGLGNRPHGKAEIFGTNDVQRDAVWVQAPDEFVGGDYGLPVRSYRSRGAAVGNAVVPQVAEWIGRRLVESVGD